MKAMILIKALHTGHCRGSISKFLLINLAQEELTFPFIVYLFPHSSTCSSSVSISSFSPFLDRRTSRSRNSGPGSHKLTGCGRPICRFGRSSMSGIFFCRHPRWQCSNFCQGSEIQFWKKLNHIWCLPWMLSVVFIMELSITPFILWVQCYFICTLDYWEVTIFPVLGIEKPLLNISETMSVWEDSTWGILKILNV